MKLASPAPKTLRLWIGAALLFNFVLLLWVQHYWHGDFPFEDEWGYVARIQALPKLGFFHYLFDRYQTYFVPVLMFVWYQAYTWTHLNIEAIRYFGALVVSSVALLFSTLLYRRAARHDFPVWGLLVYAPFLVCSLNHYAVYYQSIESVTQPFLFGMVLCAFWAAEQSLKGSRTWLWMILAVIFGLVGTGTYAPGLSILPAIAGALFLIQRRLSWANVLVGLLGILCILAYVHAGHGLDNASERPSLTLGDLVRSFLMWVGLTGNAVFSPHVARFEFITYLLGAMLLAAQGTGLFLALKQAPERRRQLFLPIALTLYNNLVFLEILDTRLHVHESGLESTFTPRYSILMLAGPVSVMFYLVMLGNLNAQLQRLATAALLALGLGTLAAEGLILVTLPHYAAALATVRSTLVQLKAEPNAFEQQQMLLTEPMIPLVYPGKLFLQQEALSLYHEQPPPQPPVP